MYERLTDRARKVMRLANDEATRWNHDYIGTEHVLLGLIAEGSGVAARILKNLGVDLRQIRREVEQLHHPGPDRVAVRKLPQVPRAKRVIEYAMTEARNLGHDYVGTEHILLGLLREQLGVAAQVLMNQGLKLEDVRAELLDLLSPNLSARGDSIVSPAARVPFAPRADLRKWLGLLFYICSLVTATGAVAIAVVAVRNGVLQRQNGADIDRDAMEYLAVLTSIAIASGYGGYRLRRNRSIRERLGRHVS